MAGSDKGRRLIDWGVALRHWGPQGESPQGESGDRYVVKPSSNGILVGVIDGLGHGAEAATAADAAAGVLEKYADELIISLMTRCHERLHFTRGVVMSLAFFDAGDDTMMWLGVGNVEGALLRADQNVTPNLESLLLRGGVVGYRLPPLRASVIPVMPGDTLILATDGIRSDFAHRVIVRDPPQKIADAILARYGKETDDALVLVARYRGRAS